MDDYVYMSITYFKVPRSKAEAILKAAMDVAGPVDMSVHYASALEDEDED